MATICIKTFGCSCNFAESEMMQGILANAGFRISSEEEAELVILSICTVKGDSQALRQIRNARKNYPDKKIVVAGCITKEIVPKVVAIAPDASFVSTNNIREIVSVVKKTLNNTPIVLVAQDKTAKVGLPRKRKNSVVGIVPICSGCDSACAYCSVRLVKGRLVSYPVDAVVDEVKRAVSEGCREIWLTGQDTGCYGIDLGTDLPSLLKKVLAVEGSFFVRLGMANPNHVLKNIEGLVECFRHPKMFKFLHVPVQAGSEEVVKAMRRRHSVDDFRQIVKRFRKEFPEITIATDIICGFPGETKEQFDETIQLIKEVRPDVVNISRFVPREGTPAALMPQLPGSEIKERSKKLTEVFKRVALEQNQKWKNWQGEIVIDEHGKNNTSIGRNFAYKQVVVAGRRELGEVLKVKVVKATSYDLRAVVHDGAGT